MKLESIFCWTDTKFYNCSRIEIWTQESEITLTYRSKLCSIRSPERKMLKLLGVTVKFDDRCRIARFCWMQIECASLLNDYDTAVD